MRVATNLADVKGLKRYALHPDNDDARFLQRVIGLFYPSASFVGYVPDLAAVPETTIISVDSRWPRALRPTSAAADLVIFPAVDVVGWEFWHFGRQILDDCRPGTPAELPMSAFLKALMRWEPPVVDLKEDGSITLLTTHQYYTWNHEEREAFTPMAAFVQSRLANEASKNAYAVVFQGSPVDVWRHYVASVFSKTQYLQYARVGPGDVVLSIGIDEGLELAYLTASLGNQGQLHAIDPFGLDFLGRYAWQNIGCFPNLVVQHRVAIASYHGTAKLPIDGTMAYGAAMNRVPQDASYVDSPCTTIDDFVVGNNLPRLDFIKVDIEGAEEFIIEGARNTIQRFRPQIAIAIYHSFNHLWSIPLRLMNICPNYLYFVDHYGFKQFDTVFYAIPKERVHAEFLLNPEPLLTLRDA